jgi:hypothetical protein
MAIQSDSAIKTYFETGDIPTQGEFIHFIDSKYSKFEGLGTTVSITNNYEIQIPANMMLVQIVVWTTTGNSVINLGDTLSGQEHLADEAIVSGVPRVFDINPIFSIAGQSVFLEFASGVSTGELVFYIK